MGRGRPVPGRAVSRLAGAGRSGTAATATTSAASGAATRAWPATWPRGCAAAPTCTRRPAGCRIIRSTSSPATTASRSGTWCRTTTSTTRPTARTTATASTTTCSWNCGVEGPTDDPDDPRPAAAAGPEPDGDAAAVAGRADAAGRRRVPADAAGQQQRLVPGQRDQLGRLGRWPSRNADFLRFVRELIALRKRHPALRRRRSSAAPAATAICRRTSSGTASSRATRFLAACSRTLAFALDGRQTGREPDRDFYVALQCLAGAARRFSVPLSPSGRHWRRLIDTALASPQDIVGLDEGPRVPESEQYRVAPHGLIVLISEG